MKKLLLIIALLFSFLGTSVVVSSSYAAKNPTPTNKVAQQKKNVNNKKKDAKKKTVKPAKQTKKIPAKKTLTNKNIKCVGPDGKVAYAPQKDCDNLWNFWNNHKPSNPNNNNTGGSSNNNQSSSNSNQSTSNPAPVNEQSIAPTPTATPVPSETPTPTEAPANTSNETPVPSETPTPTSTPTVEPTVEPTQAPTPTPTEAPTSTPTPTVTPEPRYKISGNVFNDANENGVKDQGEENIKNVNINYTGAQAGNVWANNEGVFTLENALGGEYTFSVDTPEGYYPITPNPVTVTVSSDTQVNFGVIRIYYIAGFVYYDENNNLVLEDNEVVIPDATIYLSDGTDQIQTTTDAAGFYGFAASAGNYTVTLTVPGVEFVDNSNQVTFSLIEDLLLNFGVQSITPNQ